MSVEATATPALPRFDVVFLDLDETLCSWMAPALAKHGKTLAGTISGWQWKPGDGRKVYEILGWEKSKFWGLIDEDPNFWHGLPKLPHCDTLVTIAKQLAPVVSVLSSPHQHENCYGGKQEWIKQFLPPEIGTVLTSEKHLLARPGRLLIDDQDNKVNEFRAAGGSAILIPQHWNSAHDKAPYGVLFYLAMELEKLRQEQERAKSTLHCYDADGDKWFPVDAEELQRSADRLLAHGSDQGKPLAIEPDWPFAHPDFPAPPAGYGPGTNTGHGHAWQRPDGHYAKCLGVKHCLECSRDLKHFYGDDAEIVKGDGFQNPPHGVFHSPELSPEHRKALIESIRRTYRGPAYADQLTEPFPVDLDPTLETADSPIAKVLDAAGELEPCFTAGSDIVYHKIQQELADRVSKDAGVPAEIKPGSDFPIDSVDLCAALESEKVRRRKAYTGSEHL